MPLGANPMSDPAGPPTDRPEAPAEHFEGLSFDVSGDDDLDRKLAAIEMAGEEAAAGFRAEPHAPLAPEVRYLHVSRTIHQLVTDRNRSVGIFLFVASLLFGASSALLNAHPVRDPILPLAEIQYWCLPVTFGTLAVLGAFISLILIRTRIGLIYEVAKMNALLGLPSDRVKRVNPLSIFFLMHLMVATLGGASAGFVAGMILRHLGYGPEVQIGGGLTKALGYVAFFQAIYYVTILRATTGAKLEGAKA